MKVRSREEDALIESAVTFMVEKINEFNTNPKPLILHSLRVGLRLYAKGESTKVVIAGILHDLLEDTKCTEADIKEKFGSDMLGFVSIFNYDDPNIHYTERWTKAISKMVASGRDAAILKLVDIRDNLNHLELFRGGKEAKEGLMWRFGLVRDSFKDLLKDDPDYQQYVDELAKIQKTLEKA